MPEYERPPKPLDYTPTRPPDWERDGQFSDPISNMTNVAYHIPRNEEFQYGNGAMQGLLGCGPTDGSSERSSAPEGGGGGILGAIGRGISGISSFASGLLGGRTPSFNREARPCSPAPAPAQPETILV